MPFLKPKSFFTTKLHCIFLTQTLHTFYKSSLSKCKFSDFALLGLKFTKFLMSFCKQKVSFSSKFGSFFSVMRDHSSVLFRLKLYVLKVQISRLATACIKIHQIPHVIFGTKSQFFFKLCITLQFHETKSSNFFSCKSLYALDKRILSKCRFLDF